MKETTNKKRQKKIKKRKTNKKDAQKASSQIGRVIKSISCTVSSPRGFTDNGSQAKDKFKDGPYL